MTDRTDARSAADKRAAFAEAAASTPTLREAAQMAADWLDVNCDWSKFFNDYDVPFDCDGGDVKQMVWTKLMDALAQPEPREPIDWQKDKPRFDRDEPDPRGDAVAVCYDRVMPGESSGGAAYWRCAIGPIQRKHLPNGADGPLRRAVKKAFGEEYGAVDNLICMSGWGWPDLYEPRGDAVAELERWVRSRKADVDRDHDRAALDNEAQVHFDMTAAASHELGAVLQKIAALRAAPIEPAMDDLCIRTGPQLQAEMDELAAIAARGKAKRAAPSESLLLYCHVPGCGASRGHDDDYCRKHTASVHPITGSDYYLASIYVKRADGEQPTVDDVVEAWRAQMPTPPSEPQESDEIEAWRRHTEINLLPMVSSLLMPKVHPILDEAVALMRRYRDARDRAGKAADKWIAVADELENERNNLRDKLADTRQRLAETEMAFTAAREERDEYGEKLAAAEKDAELYRTQVRFEHQEVGNLKRELKTAREKIAAAETLYTRCAQESSKLVLYYDAKLAAAEKRTADLRIDYSTTDEALRVAEKRIAELEKGEEAKDG